MRRQIVFVTKLYIQNAVLNIDLQGQGTYNNVKKTTTTSLLNKNTVVWQHSTALIQITTKFMKIKIGFSAFIQSNNYSSGVCSALNLDIIKQKIGPW